MGGGGWLGAWVVELQKQQLSMYTPCGSAVEICVSFFLGIFHFVACLHYVYQQISLALSSPLPLFLILFSSFFCVDKHKQTNRNSDANAWGNFRNAFLYAFPVYVMSLCVRGEIFGLETQHTFTFPFPWPKGNKTKNNKGESRRRLRTRRRSSSIKPNLKHTPILIHIRMYEEKGRNRNRIKKKKKKQRELEVRDN